MKSRLRGAGEPDPVEAVEEERGAVRRLARRAADHHRLGAEGAVVLDEVGQHEARHEQRPVEDLEVLEVRVVGDVAGRGGEPVVGRGKVLAVRTARRGTPSGPPRSARPPGDCSSAGTRSSGCPPPPRARCCAPRRRSPRAAPGRTRHRPARPPGRSPSTSSRRRTPRRSRCSRSSRPGRPSAPPARRTGRWAWRRRARCGRGRHDRRAGPRPWAKVYSRVPPLASENLETRVTPHVGGDGL